MDYMALLNSKKVRRILIVCVIIGVGTGGLYINRYFKNSRQQDAIVAFNEAMQTYVTALVTDLDYQKNGAKAAWDEVELAFQTAYAQNQKAEFAPFFLIYNAQALAAQQKYTQAANMVGEALGRLSINSPFYDLYVIMQATFLIDGGEHAGVEQLKNLANGANSDYQAMAQYYLAQYYLSQNQIDLAQDLFTKLAKQDSVWATLAKEYI